MRTIGEHQTAEDSEDLAQWLRNLTDCPAVTRTVPAHCDDGTHGDERADWFYVEADPRHGVARLRCLAGGHVRQVVDSADRWTFPGVWSCRACNQSIAEVVYGIHDDGSTADWLAVAARCVECGEVTGVTDLVLADCPVEGLLASL